MNLSAISVVTMFTLMLCSKSAFGDAPEEQFFDSGGTRMSFRVAGAGPPVVLLHGFSHSTQEDWVATGIYGLLEQDYQVIGLDARGHGKSETPHAPSRYGVTMVHDVVRLLEHLGIDEAHIVGYSMGGFIALKLAALHPERVSSIVLGGAGWINAQWDELGPAWEAQANELEAEVGATGNNDPFALAAVLRKEYELKVDEEALRGCSMPSLAIMGEQDFLRPSLDALAEVMPHLKVKVLPGQDHLTTLSDPGFATVVRNFLANVSARQPSAEN
jgi:pimeloyl-ACP methyl ester carboxylesterase